MAQTHPAASPVDGLFDVFVMQGTTKREILAKLLRRHFRRPGNNSGARLYRGRRVSVAASRSARNELELIPGVLPVLVSPETAMTLNQPLISADGNGSRLTGAMTA